jgi:ribosomal protein S18 acetylase RimI-like enzyme
MYRKVGIRRYRAEDEADLFGLARDVFGDRPGWHDRRTLDVIESDLVFVAETEGLLAGYAAVEHEGDTVRIEQLLVSPMHDDEQVEEQLLEYAEGYAISLRARALQAVVERDNEQALTFYRARGFVPIGPELVELVLPHAQ